MRPFRWLYQCIDVFSQECSETNSMVRLHFKQYIDWIEDFVMNEYQFEVGSFSLPLAYSTGALQY